MNSYDSINLSFILFLPKSYVMILSTLHYIHIHIITMSQGIALHHSLSPSTNDLKTEFLLIY